MSKTTKKIEKIIDEIENDIILSKGNNEEKSVSQVVDILLDKENGGLEKNNSEKKFNESEFYLDMDELLYWKEKNNKYYMVEYYRGILSHRRFIGKAINFVKKIIRKMVKFLIEPIVKDQNEFNASVTASINAICNNEIVTRGFIKSQENQRNLIDEQIRQISISGDKSLESFRMILEKQNSEIKLLKNKMNEFRVSQSDSDGHDCYNDIDYFKFENHFRGSRSAIKKSLQVYVDYFIDKDQIIDLGCGRGEFLELMKEKNIQSIGVDFYKEFVEYCSFRGFQAVEADAIEYLIGLEDDSVGGIFAAQLVEHLQTKQLLQLCIQAYKKLEKGSYLILETPNPTSLSIYTNAFYIDPSHVKPVHPKTLEYFLNQAGFKDVQVLFTEQSKVGYRLPLLNSENIGNLKEFNDGINCISDIIFGSQDYAVIAQK